MVTATKTSFKELKLTTVTPDPDQPRKVFSDEGIWALAQSMMAEGLDLPTEPDNYGLTMREIPRGGRVRGLRTGQRAVRESESE